MLVLVTHREDLTADLVVLELERRDVSFLRFNSEDYPSHAALCWTPGRGQLSLGEWAVAANEISAIWWRRPLQPTFAHCSEAEASWAAGEAEAALEGFWRMTDAHWVNRPEADASADCKPEQLIRARRVGFEIPATLVTNEAAAVRGFAAKVGPIVCKALRVGVVPTEGGEELFFTSVLTGDDLAALDEMGPEPYLFQAVVPKQYDVRVTVVGDDVWACRIESQADPSAPIDWRQADVEHLGHEVEPLPERLADRCRRLTRSYGLRFAAIDLARRDDGGYSFFELNPNGEWGWIEQFTELPLSASLVTELVGGAR